MKILVSKLFWFFVFIVLVSGAGGYFYFNSIQKVEYVTAEVERGSLKQTVSVTGRVKSASEIELNFKTIGTITELNVDTGDTAEKDQVIAKLKSTDLEIDISKARANLTEAQANLSKVLVGSTVEEIEVAKAALQKLETDLSNAKANLVNTEKTYSQVVANTKQNLFIDISTSITKSSIALELIADIFNYEGDSNNFQTSNVGLRNSIESQNLVLLGKLNTAKNLYNEADLTQSDEVISQAATVTLDLLAGSKQIVDDMRTLLNFTLVTTALPQSEIDTLKTSVNTQRTAIDTTLSTLQSSIQSFVNAQIDFLVKTDSSRNDILVAERNITKAQADLSLKEAPSRPEDLALYRARLQRAEADLRLAQEKLEDTILRSPIAGVIIEVNYDVGEQTSATTPIIKLVAINNHEIEVDIPESDIAKIEVDRPVSITLDAFNDDDIFVGSIMSINPAQTQISDVVYYKVTVVFAIDQSDKAQNLLSKIKPGMTANIEVLIFEKDNVIIIPGRAVKEVNGKFTVQILENEDVVKEVAVTVGSRGDDGLVEIISGLTTGQQVITFIREP